MGSYGSRGGGGSSRFDDGSTDAGARVARELVLVEEAELDGDGARSRDEGAERRALAPAWVERLRHDFCAADFFAFDDHDDVGVAA
jgi:hypothetical protein